MPAPLITARGLSKTYRVYSRPWDRLREALFRRSLHRPFVALSEVSFELQAGESLGIIGENGAGKSTLLKILAGIVQPTSGTLASHGRIASILELGSGFHPEMTGRQNIVLNAAMLGLSAADVAARLPSILDFSELGDFIDQPVKCYSTGMTMRLGFAIATQVEPDILIIDEALSVGDGYFQKKCMDRLLELVAQGRTLLFCSHAMYYISHFCQRALWLRHGQPAVLGSAAEVVREYENYLLAKSAAAAARSEVSTPRGIQPARILALRQAGAAGPLAAAAPLLPYRDPWELEIEWESDDARRAFHLAVGIDRVDGVQVCAFATQDHEAGPFSGQHHYRLRLRVPELALLKGEYALTVFLLDEEGLHVWDRVVEPRAFRIEPDRYRVGVLELPHSWELEGPPALRAAGGR